MTLATPDNFTPRDDHAAEVAAAATSGDRHAQDHLPEPVAKVLPIANDSSTWYHEAAIQRSQPSRI